MSRDNAEGQRPRAGRDRPGRRRRNWSRRALIVLILLNVGVLAAWTVQRRSHANATFCANCHNMTAHVDSYLNSDYLDSVHRRANVGCKDCHSDYTMVDEALSVVAYLAGDYEKVFRRRKLGEEMCTGCHIGLDHVAARTDFLARNPHRGHYPDLRCGACHLAHARQVDYCGSCHDNGGQRLTGEAVVARAAVPWLPEGPPGAAGPKTMERVNHE